MDVKIWKPCYGERTGRAYAGGLKVWVYTQSTVSFQIKQLEKELSIPLFERIGHTCNPDQ